jgi:hypothetical protein
MAGLRQVSTIVNQRRTLSFTTRPDVPATLVRLLQGLKCVLPQGEVQAACIAEGLIAITAGENVLRLAPPLVVTDADLDEAMAMLRRATLRVLPSKAKAAAK